MPGRKLADQYFNIFPKVFQEGGSKHGPVQTSTLENKVRDVNTAFKILGKTPSFPKIVTGNASLY